MKQVWIECENCGGDGFTEHDCFEDTCCCEDPEDETCSACNGRGGFYRELPDDYPNREISMS